MSPGIFAAVNAVSRQVTQSTSVIATWGKASFNPRKLRPYLRRSQKGRDRRKHLTTAGT
jgi:hypothetical protein